MVMGAETDRGGRLEWDVATGTLHLGGTTVTLPKREMDLLDALALRVGEVVSRDELRHLVWNDACASPRTVDVYVSRLRRRLRSLGHPGIATVYQRGYRLLGLADGEAS